MSPAPVGLPTTRTRKCLRFPNLRAENIPSTSVQQPPTFGVRLRYWSLKAEPILRDTTSVATSLLASNIN